MDAEALRQAVEHAGLAAAGIGFLAGLMFSFNPVALASIPVSLAYVTRGRDKSQALLFGAMFILGMILTHVVLGLVAGLGGKWAAQVTGRGWGLFLGPLLIVLGLMWAGWLRVPLPSFGFRATRPTAAWGAFLLGIPFAIAACPVCTPALVVLLGVTAGIGSVLLGVVLLLAFALGRAVPLAVGAFAVSWLENLNSLARYRRGFEIAGGLTLIVMGLYMLNAVLFWIPALAM
jgi:cytochrome c-type biogenesis protein